MTEGLAPGPDDVTETSPERLAELEQAWQQYYEELLPFHIPFLGEAFTHLPLDLNVVEAIDVREVGVGMDGSEEEMVVPPAPQTESERLAYLQLIQRLVGLDSNLTGPPEGYTIADSSGDQSNDVLVHLYQIPAEQFAEITEEVLFLHVVHPGTIGESFFIGPSTPCFE